jgi:dipeptidyl aminopeptidase/acylaminoacyl peptidase
MNLRKTDGIHATPDVNGTGKARWIGLILGLCVTTFSASMVEAIPLSPFRNGKLVFASDADGDLEIYTSNADGTGRTQLTFNAASDTAPVWSPDGDRIAYASNKSGNWDIYLMKSDGTSLIDITAGSTADEGAPAWSLDGRRIAFTSNRTGVKQIFVQDLADLLDGGPPVQLTAEGRNQDPSFGMVLGQERVFFTSNRDGDDEIFSVLSTGLGVLQLTSNDVPDQHPRLGRSGYLYYQHKAGGRFKAWRMNPKGTGAEPVPLGASIATMPTGSPDGERVAYVAGKNRKTELYVADVDGGNPVRLTADKAVDELPDWQVILRAPIELPEIYDVTVVPHGLEVEVRFKTRKVVTSPAVELLRGAALESFAVGQGSGKIWSVTAGNLDPATTYDLQIAVQTAPGTYAYYDHPTPVTTLRRKVTFILRYAYILEDSDPESCGDLNVGAKIVGTDLGVGIGGADENACTGAIWNFPNKQIVVDDVASDTLTIFFRATDDDTPWDDFEKATGSSTVELYDFPESFTKTKITRINQPDPSYPGDLWLDLTFDYRVEYH